MSFPIISIDPESVIGDEQLGSKTKFWFLREGQRWLFKEARPHTGEDWAEKIASQVAHVVGIPAAIVELAEFQGRRGCASMSFIHRNTQGLIHGNEILTGHIAGYDRTKKLHQSDHTYGNVLKAVAALFELDKVAGDALLTQVSSYLVLDALVGNTDRHHENWGLIIRLEQPETGRPMSWYLSAAPSFDHASSLGRELTDSRRLNDLKLGRVERYVRRGTGGVYLDSHDKHGANPLHLVELLAPRLPEYFRPALTMIRSVTVPDICASIDEIPVSRMSGTARDFARVMLTCSANALNNLTL